MCATPVARNDLFYAEIPVQIGGGKFVAEQHRVFILHVIIPAIAGIAGEGVLSPGTRHNLLLTGIGIAPGIAFADAGGSVLFAAVIDLGEGRQI